MTVVCDENKLDIKGCIGTPDLIVEILSPSTVERDLKEKLDLYEKSRVREYWVVEPYDAIVQVFILNQEGRYLTLKPLVRNDKLQSHTIEGLTIDLKYIFPEIVEESESDYGKNTERL